MKRVALGMSGGIDSTMSALILLEQGYEVIGLTMSIWDESIPIREATKSGCFGPGEADDLLAAQDACQKLGIEHHIIKLQAEYKENVLSYFCSTYLDGKTPNPCVFCNQRMKFGFLPQRARQMGLEFDFFATGHYVRNGFNADSGRWEIRKASDLSKDQSYFLTFLSQEQIATTLFPLGEMRKQDLRWFAEEHGFGYLTEKKESQDFLETDDYSVLFEEGTFQPGEIADFKGKVVGKHQGLIYCTIGQRKNLGLSGMPEPYYVLNIDAPNNRVIVGPQSMLYSDTLTATGINWVSINGVGSEMRAETKIRLGHDAAPCSLIPLENDLVKVVFDSPQLSVTPGQLAVFYDGDRLLGGGIIA